MPFLGLLADFKRFCVLGLSVAILGGLAVLRARFNAYAGAGVVALFAFFHGYAHGLEMPDAASLGSYGSGFLVATALLHGLGFAIMRIAVALKLALPRGVEIADPSLSV